jgi:hypothetical protein
MGSVIVAQQAEYENYNGIFYEIRPDTANINRYTEDNEIYQTNNVYYFSYQYVTKRGEKLYFQPIYETYITIEDEKEVEKRFRSPLWEFIPEENLSDEVVIAFQMHVLPNVCNGVQSCIEFRYKAHNGEFAFQGTTGLIENEKNIWLHPPRSYFFTILQLNPFPFIQKPYEKGNQWYWSLKMGDKWGDHRWKEWEGTIENQYVYEITDTNSMIQTHLGALNCYKIDSYAENELGKTYLTAYFNETYGFVRLEYINIDGSTLDIELYKADIK